VDKEQLIQELNNRGKDQGFLVEKTENLDLAWCLREGESVISFLVGEIDSTDVFQKTMNIYWSSADYTVKPWSHYCIMLKNFTPQHKTFLQNFANQYRIKIFEDIEGIHKSTQDDVNYLISIFKTFRISSINELKDKMSEWNAQKTKTSKKIIKYVEPDAKNNLIAHVENLNSRETLPLILKIGSARQEGLLVRGFQDENGFDLRTEHRNLPLILEINISKSLEMKLGFEYDKANIYQAINFHELLKEWDQKEEINLIVSNSGEKILSLKKE
jgi:hypothetical protein